LQKNIQKKMKIKYLSLTFLTLIFFSCQSRPSKDNVYQDNAHNIEFERFIVDSVYFGVNLELQIVINYPVSHHNPAVLDSLQRLMTASATQGAEFEYDYRKPEIFVQQFADYHIEKFRKNDSLNTAQQIHIIEFTSDTDSIIIQNGIFCFTTFIYYFRGGAHAIYGKFSTCVDLETGRKLTFNDFFAKDSEDILTDIIKNIIANDPHDADYDFFISEIKPNDNFYLEREGIIFVYNPYEIAPYSAGIIEVFIPFQDIAPFLLPNLSSK